MEHMEEIFPNLNLYLKNKRELWNLYFLNRLIIFPERYNKYNRNIALNEYNTIINPYIR